MAGRAKTTEFHLPVLVVTEGDDVVDGVGIRKLLLIFRFHWYCGARKPILGDPATACRALFVGRIFRTNFK